MDEALNVLRRGEVALLPTDTVLGLAAVPGTPGHEQIYDLKRRPREQALPWLVAGVEALDAYGIDVPGYAKTLAQFFWPGALTLVVKASDAAKELGGMAADGTIALRCPDSEACLDILTRLNCPLACTSANLHGQPAPAGPDQVCPELSDIVCAPGSSGAGQSSTIVDCTGSYPKVLRENAIKCPVVMTIACAGC